VRIGPPEPEAQSGDSCRSQKKHEVSDKSAQDQPTQIHAPLYCYATGLRMLGDGTRCLGPVPRLRADVQRNTVVHGRTSDRKCHSYVNTHLSATLACSCENSDILEAGSFTRRWIRGRFRVKLSSMSNVKAMFRLLTS